MQVVSSEIFEELLDRLGYTLKKDFKTLQDFRMDFKKIHRNLSDSGLSTDIKAEISKHQGKIIALLTASKKTTSCSIAMNVSETGEPSLDFNFMSPYFFHNPLILSVKHSSCLNGVTDFSASIKFPKTKDFPVDLETQVFSHMNDLALGFNTLKRGFEIQATQNRPSLSISGEMRENNHSEDKKFSYPELLLKSDRLSLVHRYKRNDCRYIKNSCIPFDGSVFSTNLSIPIFLGDSNVLTFRSRLSAYLTIKKNLLLASTIRLGFAYPLLSRIRDNFSPILIKDTCGINDRFFLGGVQDEYTSFVGYRAKSGGSITLQEPFLRGYSGFLTILSELMFDIPIFPGLKGSIFSCRYHVPYSDHK